MGAFKKWARRGASFTAVTAAASVVMAGIAIADPINDNIADTGAGLSLVAGSGEGATAKITVVSSEGNDGDAGCNLDGGTEKLVLSFSTPTGVTVDGDPTTATLDPLTIIACDVDYSVLVKAGAGAVSGTITATIAENTSGGGRYNNNVGIPVTVTQPASTNTAPQVSVTGVSDGGEYRLPNVPQPGCSVVDAEDTNESATPQISNGAYDALGSHTVTCSYTDGGQLTRSASATYTVLRALDTTPPVITYTLTPVDGLNGWHRGNVILDWTVTENESPETLQQLSGCTDVTVSSDQVATNYTCSASSEGGQASVGPVTIKRDGTAPTPAYDRVVAGTEGTNGWYKSDVTVRFSATDATSGVAPASQDVITEGEGSSVTVGSPAFTDNAGNTRAAGYVTSPAFKIDKGRPHSIVFSGVPSSGVYFGSVPAESTISCDAQDDVSGLASCVVSGYSSAVGTHTLTATATDVAGNFLTATTTYTVLAWDVKGFYAPVDMGSGAINTVKAGSTVPLKFELFAQTELTQVSAIKSFTVSKINCGTLLGATEDAIEEYSTGNTSLRYDSTGGQFIQNWKVPTGSNLCYRTTMTAQDGSVISAVFKTK